MLDEPICLNRLSLERQRRSLQLLLSADEPGVPMGVASLPFSTLNIESRLFSLKLVNGSQLGATSTTTYRYECDGGHLLLGVTIWRCLGGHVTTVGSTKLVETPRVRLGDQHASKPGLGHDHPQEPRPHPQFGMLNIADTHYH